MEIQVYEVKETWVIKGRGKCIALEPKVPDSVKSGDSVFISSSEDLVWKIVGVERAGAKAYSLLVTSDNGIYPEVGNKVFLSNS